MARRRERRICLESETDLTQLEQPCACKGSLAYAHHECVQRWIDERRGPLERWATCEICGQPFSSGRGWRAPPLRTDELPALARYVLLGRAADWAAPAAAAPGQRRGGGGGAGGSAWAALTLTACCFLLVRHVLVPAAVESSEWLGGLGVQWRRRLHRVLLVLCVALNAPCGVRT